jgi:hypothetical protein
VTRLGAAYGAMASVVFPLFFAAISGSVERVQRFPVSRPFWSALQWAIPLWLVILPGALVAGVVLAQVLRRGYIRRDLTAGAAAFVLTTCTAGSAGALNFAMGDPCGLRGIFAVSLWGAFRGGIFASLFFFVVTIPISVYTGIRLRRAVSASCDHIQ